MVCGVFLITGFHIVNVSYCRCFLCGVTFFSVLQNAPFVVGARLVRYYVCNLFLGNMEIVQKVMRNSEAVMK